MAGPVLHSVFGAAPVEHGARPLRLQGALPPELNGTFYRNGPAAFNAGIRPHWFDGTGAVSAVRLRDGSAQGLVKLTHSPSADHDAGRARNRYAGYLQKMSWPQRARVLAGAQAARNMASINVLPWQGRLFALMETTPPLELDPVSLDTVGETDLEGVVLGAWNGHPRRVPSRATTYQFGVRTGPKVFLDVFALPDEGAARRIASVPLRGMMEVHDFFATERHLVFLLPPLTCSPLRMLWEGSGFGALRWQPGMPAEVLVLPIDNPEVPVRMETEPFFFWHGANAYEEAGRIRLDLFRYPDYAATAQWLARTPAGEPCEPTGCRLWRAELDLERREMRWSPRSPCTGEFPAVSPACLSARHRAVWMAGWAPEHDGIGWPDRLLRLDVESGQLEAIRPSGRCIVGEPTLVARSAWEDDVWVLCLVLDLEAQASYLGIWDGARPGDEPVARAWFDHPVPLALHGTWVAAA
jgi:all-trans-8'-apo-beta-carotenal 15,15'-oxygenase